MTIKKGKIDYMGNLMIKRGHQFKIMLCPHNSGNCGDACPLFGEPEYEKHTDGVIDTMLPICQQTIYFESFTDERNFDEEKNSESF